MVKPLISIIIPVYKVPNEDLKRCIESLLSQSLTNIEIIIINDCSPFLENGMLLSSFAKKDNRILYINLNENKGVSNARNIGIEKSNGDYLTFIDADDYVEPDYLYALWYSANSLGADMVLSNFKIETIDGTISEQNNTIIDKIISTDADIISAIESIWGSVWAKLFRKEILSKFNFNIQCKHYEDYLYVWQAILNCKKIISVGNVSYHYIQRQDSVSHQEIDQQKWINLWNSFYHLIAFSNKFLNDKENKRVGDFLFFYVCSISIFDLALFQNRALFSEQNCKSIYLKFAKNLDFKTHCKSFLSRIILNKYKNNIFMLANSKIGRVAKFCCLYEMYYQHYRSNYKALRFAINRSLKIK